MKLRHGNCLLTLFNVHRYSSVQKYLYTDKAAVILAVYLSVYEMMNMRSEGRLSALIREFVHPKDMSLVPACSWVILPLVLQNFAPFMLFQSMLWICIVKSLSQILHQPIKARIRESFAMCVYTNCYTVPSTLPRTLKSCNLNQVRSKIWLWFFAETCNLLSLYWKNELNCVVFVIFTL